MDSSKIREEIQDNLKGMVQGERSLTHITDEISFENLKMYFLII